MRKIRIGFVGCGFMGQLAHIRHYAAVENCELVAVAEPRAATAAAVAARYGIGRVYTGHREMLDAEELDGVVATLMFNHHAAVLPEIYGRVGYVLTEKPLADSTAAGRALVAAAASAGTVHMVGYHKRSDPAVVEARRLVDEWRSTGHHGNLRYVRVAIAGGDWTAGAGKDVIDLGEPKPPSPFGASGESPRRAAYVSFVNYFIHQVNLLRHVLDEDYTLAYADPSGRTLTARTSSGTVGVIELLPYELEDEWQESVLVGFDRAALTVVLPAPLAPVPGKLKLTIEEGHTQHRQLTFGSSSAMFDQARAFVAVCAGERDPPCAASEALRDLEIADDYIDRRSGPDVPA